MLAIQLSFVWRWSVQLSWVLDNRPLVVDWKDRGPHLQIFVQGG